MKFLSFNLISERANEARHTQVMFTRELWYVYILYVRPIFCTSI